MPFLSLRHYNAKNSLRLLFTTVLFACLHFMGVPLHAQNTDSLSATRSDSARLPLQVSGGITVTNNGISPVPSLSLGKPAALFDLAVGGKRLSFEPQFRFALDGRPWSFIFWWRYKLVQGKKLTVNLSAHPALVFSNSSVFKDGHKLVTTTARRMGAAELVPTWHFSKTTEAGFYFLKGGSLDRDGNTRIHMIAVRGSFGTALPGRFRLKTAPQLYYLNLNGYPGYYTSASFVLERSQCPVSISSILNKELKSRVPGSKHFIWNIGLAYAFKR